jgi:SnoaL-like domain
MIETHPGAGGEEEAMSDDAAVRDLVERDRISQIINTLFVATDARDWARVRGCFAEKVAFDMTSLVGGSPSTLTPAEIAAGWETGLQPIEWVHHQTGNLSVSVQDREADASCYGIAYHYRRTYSGRNTRVFVGSYDFHLRKGGEGWTVDLFRFKVKFVDGNLELEKAPAP